MEIESYISQIINNGKIEDMEKLSYMLEDILEIIKKYDPECYNEFKMELYQMAYGMTLNRKMAEEIVNKMRPEGEKWSFAETRKLQQQRGLNNVNETDFYVVINSAYNDYRDIFGEDVEGYIRFTMDFINDEDAKEGKVFKYFT